MKKVVIALLVLFPASAFACSSINLIKPTCSIITEQQLISNSQQTAAFVISKGYGNGNFSWDWFVNNTDRVATSTIDYQYQIAYNNNEQTNTSCKNQWDAYNKQLSDYNVCLAKQNFSAETVTKCNTLKMRALDGACCHSNYCHNSFTYY